MTPSDVVAEFPKIKEYRTSAIWVMCALGQSRGRLVQYGDIQSRVFDLTAGDCDMFYIRKGVELARKAGANIETVFHVGYILHKS